MIHPDRGSDESWTAEANTEQMRAEFAGWEPPSVHSRFMQLLYDFTHDITQYHQTPVIGPIHPGLEIDGPSPS